MHSFCKPYGARMHFFYCRSRLFPELERNKRRHIASKSVNRLRPHTEAFYLVIPERLHVIVKVYDIRPFAEMIPETPVLPSVKELGMTVSQNGIRRRVVVDNIYDAFHASFMYLGDQKLEVIHCSVSGVDISVIPVGIWAAQAAFFSLNTDRVYRHEPYDVCSKRLYSVQIRD